MNGGQRREGRMASAPDAEPREIEFRRRWYEAHARRAQADIDGGHFKDWLRDIRTAGSEALKIRNRLASSRDLEKFRAEQHAWAFKKDVGFKGHDGAMLINSLVKRTDDPASLTHLLATGLTPPTDRESAGKKIDALVEHIDRIRVGAHPAPLRVAFMLPYFWALEQPDRWPVFWRSSREYLEVSTGTKFSGSPADRYLRFLELANELDGDYQRLARVTGWWGEKRPVFLDPVLVDRCAYGMDPETIPRQALRDNAQALVSIAGHLGQTLADGVSEALGFTCEVTKPSLYWREDRPRADFWAGWNRKTAGPRLWLWVNHRVAAIGIVPTNVRKGWADEARDIVASNPVDGFTLMATRGASHGKDMGFMGRQGSFIYGRYYEPDQLADLDLKAEVMTVATAARPLLDALNRRADGEEPPDVDPSGADDPPPPTELAEAVAEFRRDTDYPTAHDDRRIAERHPLLEMLKPDRLAITDRAELRRIWTTRAYGSPGPQANLNRTLRDADDAEYERILEILDYLCWGGGNDASRIDRVLDDPEYKVNGLGESVISKLLAICYPDRYLCVYPYSGKQGKLRMLRALDLQEPHADATRGRRHVDSNDRLRKRLERFFPGDPWGMMRFLYWYLDWDGESTPGETEQDQPSDPIDAAAEDLLVGRSFLDDIVAMLEDKGQVILYGPPGTGKTYLAQRLAAAIARDPADRALVQFHPSTSYEDFFEGYRPEEGSDGQIVYRLTQGPLALMAERAAQHPQRRQVMVIDEINRANLPKVLGELLFLFEYRDKSISTLYRPEGEFELPESLWFIGTMNTADRSIALVDAALRRRFHFVPFFPDRGPIEGLLDRWLEREGQPSWVGELVAMVNDELTESLGGDLQLGASHFMKKDYGDEPDENDPTLGRIWRFNIEPFIEDQFFGNEGQINKFRLGQVVQRYRSQSGRDDPREPAVGGNG